MQLSDFFAPLNLYNISIFILCFFIFDAMGFLLAKRLEFPDFLRGIYWIFGLGLFVFVWFILHFWLPFDARYILISLVVCGVGGGYYYFKNLGPLTLLKNFLAFPWIYLFLLLSIKRIFFLVSIPPFYWDEMAYHIYSPAKMIIQTTWDFANQLSLFPMLPRTLDTAFILLFGLSKTYAIARVLHLLFFITTLSAIGMFLKKKINLAVSIVYSFFALYLYTEVLTEATTNYVDAAAASLSNLLLFMVVYFLIKPKRGTFYAITALIGLCISIKYTILGFVSSIVLSAAIFYTLKYLAPQLLLLLQGKRVNLKLTLPRSWVSAIAFSSVIFVTLGGYWYLKNLFVTGNPIYPFLFPCKAGIDCATGNEFFGTWAMQFSVENAYAIAIALFLNTKRLLALVSLGLIGAFISAFWLKKPVLRMTLFMVIIAIAVEILLTRSISGFVLRYYYHWILLVPVLIALPFAALSNNIRSKRIPMLLLGLYTLSLFASAGAISVKRILLLNSDTYFPNEANVHSYAKGQMPINEWITYQFPQAHQIINWCGQKHPLTDVYFADPNINWLSDEGGMHAYLVNCYIHNLGPDQAKGIEQSAIETRQRLKGQYFTSLERCTFGKVPEFKEEFYIPYFLFNQELVCNAEEILPSLYRIK